MFVQHGMDAHNNTWCAEPALETMFLAKRLLDRMKLAIDACHTFDGCNCHAVSLHREHQASTHRFAVEQDCTTTAHSVLAANMRAGEMQFVTQKIGEQQAYRHRMFVTIPIDRHSDFALLYTLG